MLTTGGKNYLNFSSGLDSSSEPLNMKPSSSTSQKNKPDDVAENNQVKAALKQVIFKILLAF